MYQCRQVLGDMEYSCDEVIRGAIWIESWRFGPDAVTENPPFSFDWDVFWLGLFPQIVVLSIIFFKLYLRK